MQIAIDPKNGVPIYEQLVRQVKFAVAEGVVQPGQAIPSVREMAKSLTVNPNTVQRAYLQLQNEDVLESLRGRGMVVASGALDRCKADRQQIVTQRLQKVLAEAVSSGIEEATLRKLLEEALQGALAEQASE